MLDILPAAQDNASLLRAAQAVGSSGSRLNTHVLSRSYVVSTVLLPLQRWKGELGAPNSAGWEDWGAHVSATSLYRGLNAFKYLSWLTLRGQEPSLQLLFLDSFSSLDTKCLNEGEKKTNPQKTNNLKHAEWGGQEVKLLFRALQTQSQSPRYATEKGKLFHLRSSPKEGAELFLVRYKSR